MFIVDEQLREAQPDDLTTIAQVYLKRIKRLQSIAKNLDKIQGFNGIWIFDRVTCAML